MNRREFLEAVAAAAVAGLDIADARALERADGADFYDAIAPFGNVSLLHFTDCHAQLLPMHYREPIVNLGDKETQECADGWTVVTADSSYSAHFEHTVAITAGDADILTL